MKLPLQKMKLAFAISLALVGFARVQAQPADSTILVQRPTLNLSGQLNQPLIFDAPPPPPDVGASGQRTEGASRGCENMGKQPNLSKEKVLTALVPVYGSRDSELIWGITTASRPIFWFYVPYSSKLEAEFVLQDEAEQTVYQTPVTLSGTPGLVSLSLPSKAAPLEIGKRYHWYFNIYCQPQQPPVFVDGWIKREELNPALKSQLEKATQKKRVALYAANGIWYDALSASAELRRINPKDTNWVALLRAAGLDDIALEPMVAVLPGKNR